MRSPGIDDMPNQSDAPKEEDDKDQTECFFCGKGLDRVHYHMSVRPEAVPREQAMLFCCHERCLSGVMAYTKKFLDAMDKKEPELAAKRVPSYFG